MSLVWTILRVIYRISLPYQGTVLLLFTMKPLTLLLEFSFSLLCHESFVLMLHLYVHWIVFHNCFMLTRHVLVIQWFSVTDRLLWIMDWSLVHWLSPNMTTFTLYIWLMTKMLWLYIHLSCFMWLIYLTTAMLW